MPIIMPQSSVKSFYEKVLKNQIPTEENLMGPVTMDFQKILSNFLSGNGLRAIDLGYGYGNYSIALAQKGFEVTAVDYVNSDYFKKRLQEMVLNGKITILEQDLNLFTPERKIRCCCFKRVSKDVFHFLSKSKVEDLINILVNYIVIFTDIQRKSEDGNEIFLENEARFTTDYLVNFINNSYRNWKVEIKIEAYQEKDRSGKEGSFYFKANKVTIIANNI